MGVLTSLSLPPYNFFFINFLTLSSFFFFLFKNLSKGSSKKLFFSYGWTFGYGYFLSNLYWISISLTFDPSFNYLIPFSIILVPAFLSIFYGLITYSFFLIGPKNILSAFFLFSFLFGFIEFIRGNILTGFPWNLIVYSLSKKITFVGIISIIGTYSLNLIVISFFSAPAILFVKRSKKEIIVCICLILTSVIFFSYGFIYQKNFLKNQKNQNSVVIRALGSNIDLDRFYKRNETESVIKELIKISNPDPKKNIFFIWPEGIIPDVYRDELNLYKDFFDNNFNKKHIIGIGINHKEIKDGSLKYFNSFSVYDSDLNLINDYNKIKLVPFGEFLPFETVLNKIGLKTLTNNYQSYSKGKNNKTVMEINNDPFTLKILPLICYEIIYSGSISNQKEFDLIINISEDGWFGRSIGPKQHFVHSVFRAIESGKYIVRSSNNGIAGIINPVGLIEKKVKFGEKGFIDFDESRNIKPTFFSKYGNKVFGLLILLYIFLIFSFNRIKDE